jgi:hypothetical protein
MNRQSRNEKTALPPTARSPRAADHRRTAGRTGGAGENRTGDWQDGVNNPSLFSPSGAVGGSTAVMFKAETQTAGQKRSRCSA